MKIAIYSGAIPSTTFVEHLIAGVAIRHEVFIFGVENTPKKYASKNVKVYSTSRGFLKNVLKTKWHVFVLLFTNPKRLFIALEELKNYTGLYAKWNAFSRILPVVRFLPEIFHIQWAKDLERWMFLKQQLKVKLVLSLRGAHVNYSPIADKDLADSYKVNFPKVAGFHAVSQAIALEAQKYHAAASKIKVIHSPIPNNTFNYYSTFKKSNTPTIKLCCVGRFHWKKGYKYLLDACSLLKEQNISFELVFVATNPVTEEVLFQLHQLNLEGEVTLVKGLPQAELFKFMKTFDMLVLPSLEEGIANVVLEAMAIGLPVISTNCGGMAEVVKPNKTGWLVPVRNSEALAEAIIEVSQVTAGTLQEITAQAHLLVKETFNAATNEKEFEALYRSIIN